MENLALGLMSGTSMDGIDIVIIDVDSKQLIYSATTPYEHLLANKLRDVMHATSFDMNFFAELNREVGFAFAEAAFQALEHIGQDIARKVRVIGSHGQTICHHIGKPIAYTWQIGCPYAILEVCQLPVVADFRSKNVAQGGQGAPLAPLFHQELFGRDFETTAVVNIGGISNVSIISKEKPLIGYDIGPGNCLMDAWIIKHQNLYFDANGAWAKQGKVSDELLNHLMTDSFINAPYPKSIGKEYFSLSWLDEKLAAKELPPEDVQATLLAFTAKSIANEIKKITPKKSSVFICGGGAKNAFLLETIQTYLNDYIVKSTDFLGFSSDYLEAMMIGWLAWMRVNEHEFDLSSIMGGKNKQMLGIIYS